MALVVNPRRPLHLELNTLARVVAAKCTQLRRLRHFLAQNRSTAPRTTLKDLLWMSTVDPGIVRFLTVDRLQKTRISTLLTATSLLE